MLLLCNSYFPPIHRKDPETIYLTSVRRIQGKRISDAELTKIFRKAQQAKASSQSYQSFTNKKLGLRPDAESKL